MQSRRRSWVAVAAANRKGRNRPAGWRELARLVASLTRTRVTSARARIARCWLKAQFRVAGCVRGRCFVVVLLRRSLFRRPVLKVIHDYAVRIIYAIMQQA